MATCTLMMASHNKRKVKKVNIMNELFREEIKEAEERLYKKGLYVENMEYDKDCFEVLNGDMKVLIDHLSVAQLTQLSKML